MNFYQKNSILFILLLCFTPIFQTAFAQFDIYGTPFIQNYTRKDYKSTTITWTTWQDKQGKIYASTRNDLLEYDGTNWKKFSDFAGGTPIKITTDEKGTLYMANDSDIGYMIPNENGKLVYHSLAHLLPKEHQNLSFIVKVDYFEKEIYFSGEDIYYKFNPVDSSFVVQKAKEGDKINILQFEDRLFLDKFTLGLSEKIKGEWITKIDSNKIIYQERLEKIFPYSKNKLLLVNQQAIYIYDELTNTTLLFPTPANEWIEENELYAATYFQDQSKNYYYVLASFDQGILIIDTHGKVVQNITQKTGLISNDITSLFVDNQNAIWVSSYKGLSKISFEIPFTFYNLNHNITARVNQTYKNENNEIYIAAENGLFFLKDNTFELINDFPNTQCWEIVPITDSKFVVAGGDKGFFFVADKKVIQQIPVDWFTLAVARSKQDSSIFYNGKQQGFEVLKYQENQDKFVSLGEVKAMKKNVTRKIIEDKNGNVWTLSPVSGFYQIKFKNFSKKNIEEAKVIVQTKGLEKIENCFFSQKITQNGTQIIFNSAGKEYVFNYEKEVFEPYSESNFILAQNLFIDSQNNYWDFRKKIIYQNGDKNKADSTTLLAIDGQITHVLEDTKDKKIIYWIATSEGLAVYQPHSFFGKKSDFSAYIREIKLSTGDSIIFNGAGNRAEILKNSIFDYQNNSIIFSYAAPTYYLEKETLFRFRLVGYEDKWSEWTAQNKKEYTNLHEGDYTFEVQAKNFINQMSALDSYSFEIKPPLQRTFIAYLIYFIFFILIIYLSVRFYTMRLKHSKTKLENIVKERTQEVIEKNSTLETQKQEIIIQSENLRQSNEELNVTVEMVNNQKNELEEQNRNINASITYAKRIQEAILPFEDKIMTLLKKHGNNDFCIFYKPRDVVSGDFYFFEEIDDKIIIVVADCTGHGVPGAFMSMIGNQLLNTIIKVNKITNPATILTELHEGVFEALKQNDSKNMDGMDVIVVTLHKNHSNSFSHLQYAGAMNPLYIVQNDQLEILKANKRNIGGKQKTNKNKKEIQFSTQEFYFHDKNSENQNLIPTTLYLCTDGFQDQFGGQKGKKLMLNGFRNLLLEASQNPISNQKEFFENQFVEWKQTEKQVDDILVFGLKIQN